MDPRRRFFIEVIAQLPFLAALQVAEPIARPCEQLQTQPEMGEPCDLNVPPALNAMVA